MTTTRPATRAQLITAAVDRAVEKWGESERAGSTKIIKRKSLETLQLDQLRADMTAAGATEQEIHVALREMAASGSWSVDPSCGCLDDGPS